jgi:hypothetical protein
LFFVGVLAFRCFVFGANAVAGFFECLHPESFRRRRHETEFYFAMAA